MQGRIQGARGPRPSQFLGPHAGVAYLAVCPKNGHSETMPPQILLCPENFSIKRIQKQDIAP